jgi:hypothetical protein
MDLEMKVAHWAYRAYFVAKLRLNNQSLVRRLSPLTAAKIDAGVLAQDRSPELKMFVQSDSPRGGGSD